MKEIRKIQVEFTRLNQKLKKVGSETELGEITIGKLETQKLMFKEQSKIILRTFAKRKQWENFDWAYEKLTDFDIESIGGYKTMYEMLYERQKDLSNLI